MWLDENVVTMIKEWQEKSIRGMAQTRPARARGNFIIKNIGKRATYVHRTPGNESAKSSFLKGEEKEKGIHFYVRRARGPQSFKNLKTKKNKSTKKGRGRKSYVSREKRYPFSIVQAKSKA